MRAFDRTDPSAPRCDPSRSPLVAIVVLAAVLGLPPAPAEAQLASTGTDGASPPAVFLDCQSWRNCDSDHFRTEIDFVNWVVGRDDSDIHLIFTSTQTSAGGSRYELEFVGRGEMEGLSDRLTFTSRGQDVTAEVMDGLTRTLRIGLLRFAVESGMGPDFELAYVGDEISDEPGPEEPESREGPEDPWNAWTFRLQLSGDLDLRETRTSTEVDPSFDADRVTETWKLNFRVGLDFERERRELSDGREVRDDRDDWQLTALVVRSVSPHVSVGVDADLRNSVARNQHARIRMNPAVEYNYFPYREANRRQFIAHYTVGMEHSNYMEETVYEVTEETLPMHRVGVQYRAREEWGDAGMGLDAFQYLHDRGLYSLGVSGDLSYRIFRGLELNVSGSASLQNDNIHTPAADIDDEDILLGRQSLPSSYRYRASLGFSYRWGSSFANVVNNRFPRSVRW